jgi:hypothetical protein
MISTSTRSLKRGRPPTGDAQSPAERMRRYRARRRAAGFRAVTRYEPRARARLSAGELDARVVAARELALHCLAAKTIDADRALLTKVRARLQYWSRNHKEERPPAVLREWDELLSKPWAAIALFITDPASEPARLRRLSPFTIVLNPRERKRVFSAFEL